MDGAGATLRTHAKTAAAVVVCGLLVLLGVDGWRGAAATLLCGLPGALYALPAGGAAAVAGALWVVRAGTLREREHDDAQAHAQAALGVLLVGALYAPSVRARTAGGAAIGAALLAAAAALRVGALVAAFVCVGAAAAGTARLVRLRGARASSHAL